VFSVKFLEILLWAFFG